MSNTTPVVWGNVIQLLKENISMKNYQNLNGNSNVLKYEIGYDYIKVQFSSGNPYVYSHKSAGSIKVEKMKQLATQGYGLNSYIMREARFDYEK